MVEAGAGARRRALDRFLAANDDYQAVLERRRRAELKAAGLIPVALTLVLGLLFGGAGVALLARNRRVQADRRAAAARATASSEGFARTQERFREALQVASDQGEAHRLLVGHLERWVPGTRAVLLNRNNSEDRLEAATALAEGSQLDAALEGARPRSCLAVRLSRRYDTGPDGDEVLECELCGRLPSPSSCRPLLVGGQVIGSVLAVHEHTPDAAEDERIDRSVEQAAPVLANLRNLAIAEARAATDALTGLANRRALDDTLKRLIAHAGRTMTPLSLVLMDLDKFKRINDMHGHERGDEVLAAVGALLGKALRASDVAGRSGGEEFLVLLPDTDREGAARAAETVRLALHTLAVPGLEEPVTASFGVASYPEDATDAVTLLRACDRALYAAKRDGRDRVALAGA